MSEWYDVYVLAAGRSAAVVRRFRDRWLTGLDEAALDYYFPSSDHPAAAVYSSAWDVVDRLLLEPTHDYSIYWSRSPSPGDDLLNAHLFFTGDGGLIAGVTIAAKRLADTATTLHELASSVDARYGFATGEEPPPFATTCEFKSRARQEEIRLHPH